MPLRRNPDATRRAIQNTALDLFLRRGYHTTTLGDIAGQLGITRPAILYYYASKEDLLRSIVEPAFDRLEAELDSLEATPAGGRVEPSVVVSALIDATLPHRQVVGLLSRCTNEFAVADIGRRATANSQRCARLLAGDLADPTSMIRAVAAMAALGGLMGARIELPLDPSDDRDTVEAILLAILRAGSVAPV